MWALSRLRRLRRPPPRPRGLPRLPLRLLRLPSRWQPSSGGGIGGDGGRADARMAHYRIRTFSSWVTRAARLAPIAARLGWIRRSAPAPTGQAQECGHAQRSDARRGAGWRDCVPWQRREREPRRQGPNARHSGHVVRPRDRRRVSAAIPHMNALARTCAGPGCQSARRSPGSGCARFP